MIRILTLLTVIVGPWITGMGDNGFSVLWTTEDESLGWVQLEDGQRFYDEFGGRREHSRLHHVRVKGVPEGTKVTYTIGVNDVVDTSDPYSPKYDTDRIEGTYSVKTFTRKKNTCRFSVLNDMHKHVERYTALTSQIDAENTDFIFLNGDLIRAGHYAVDSMAKYSILPLGDYAAKLPVMFSRGNHEGRGNGIINVETVFPNDGRQPAADENLPFTYMFREGPVAVIVFDSGETGDDNSIGFCGKPLYEDYLLDQLEWAKEAFKTKEWKSAKVKICMVHAPMIDPGDPIHYVVHTWMNHNIVPTLNKAGVDLMIGADLHEYQFHPAGTMGNRFPIVVNDDVSRLETIVDGKRFTVSVYNEAGDCVEAPIQ